MRVIDLHNHTLAAVRRFNLMSLNLLRYTRSTVIHHWLNGLSSFCRCSNPKLLHPATRRNSNFHKHQVLSPQFQLLCKSKQSVYNLKACNHVQTHMANLAPFPFFLYSYNMTQIHRHHVSPSWQRCSYSGRHMAFTLRVKRPFPCYDGSCT